MFNMKSWLRITLIIFVFLLINLIFNFSLWKELFGAKNLVSDNVITEFILENSYQRITHFKNPFITNTILYPFRTNYSLNDPANSYTIFYFFLRPFLNPHQFIVLVVLVSFLLNNLIMYFLLIKLKLSKYTAFLFSLVFGFTPFLSHRVQGHYTYIPIFFFPLAYLIIHDFLISLNKKNKILLAITFGILLSFILLSNFYYFFMILLGILFYSIFIFFQDKKKLIKTIKINLFYIFISALTTIATLSPWLFSVFMQIKSQGITRTSGFGGSIELSADLLNFFTPSEYNPLYKKIFSLFPLSVSVLVKYQRFFFHNWERFAYPGIILLLTYFLITFLKFKKKFPTVLWKNIKINLFVSLTFAVLTLGPFLKFFNRWMINLDGVMLIIPMPFLALHYIPVLNMLRAPMRFTPIFVFFAVLVSAYCFDFFIQKIDKKKQIIILIGFLMIFFIDQFYVIPTKLNQNIPGSIYKTLKNLPQGTVLEIPFTVRDGFNYIGFVHAIQPMVGQIIHNKPIIGGYLARVNDSVFNYYRNLKFIGYLAKIIDKGNYDPVKEQPKEINFYPYPYSINTAKNEIGLLNIKYVILKEDEKYSKYLLGLFGELGFNANQKDGDYILMER